jgi:uncharacterized membrane-anchored protein
VSGRLRIDRRTKELCKRLRRGDIAVLDHEDLDGTAARALLDLRPSAVVNAAPSITGRYPNAGPRILLEAGIPVLDAVGASALERMREGQRAEVRGESLWCDGKQIATGERLTVEAVAERMEAARQNLGQELQRFSENTLQVLAHEGLEAFADLPLPELRTAIHGRPVLIVVRGSGYKEDLAAARAFIREQRPVLIGVDGGADALVEAGIQPDLIVGDMDSASDLALRSGAEIVVHTYADGRPSPGLRRVQELGIEAKEVAAPGTSEDVAMLLAYENGAELIVAVGTHFSLIEFLDKRRLGMASTFLTRLKVGSILVDAKGLSRLYRPAIGLGPMLLLIGSALLFIAVLAVHSPAVQQWLTIVAMHVEVWLRRHGIK